MAVKVQLLLSLVVLLVVNSEVASCQEVQSVVTDVVQRVDTLHVLPCNNDHVKLIM